MKKILFLTLIAAAVIALPSCNKKGAGTTPTEDSLSQVLGQGYGAQMAAQMGQEDQNIDKEQFLNGLKEGLDFDTTKNDVSYSNGLMTGMQMAQQFQQLEDQMGVKVDKEAFYNTLAEAFKKQKGEPNMDKMQQLGIKMQTLVQKAQLEAGQRISKEGNAYIAKALKDDKDMKKAPSGIVYKIVKKGNGKLFKQGDNVMVKYTGKHIDGRVFDKSDKAVAFAVDETKMIRGFVEVLKLMSPGAKVHVIIPGNLAYGPNGNPQGGIKANETLVFDIEAGNLATPAQLQKQVQEQGMQGEPMPQGMR